MSSDNATPQVLINGMSEHPVHADDRGLNYGDGIFRTMRVVDCEPVAWAAQMQRLAHDCHRLYLPVPDAEALYDEARRVGAQCVDGVLKIVITRGSGGRGYAPPASCQPLRIVSLHAPPPAIETLELEESSIRLAQQPALAGVKHLNRLEQVLARAECADNGWPDALMRDTAGYVISTTMRNILLLRDGRWLTPRLDNAGVAGATRARIMAALISAGQPVTEAKLTADDCNAAQAMLACNSVSGVIPVVRLSGQAVPDSNDMAAYCRNMRNRIAK